MPEYLAPGVYVEERSFRSKSIEGVGTSTTGFVGATRYGPTEGEPELMTSFSQFERIYGGLDPLDYSGTEIQNYLAHGVRAFFDNGGSRLYIARAYTPPDTGTGRAAAPIPAPAPAVAEADALAISGTSRVLSALSDAITELEKAKSAAITVMRYAADQVIAARNPTTPAPTITYDYNTGDNVVTQLNAFIATLAGAEQTDVQDALDAVQTLLNNAQTAYGNAHSGLSNASSAQTAVSGAYASGVNAGNAVLDSALPTDPAAGASSTIAPLNTAVSAAETEAGDLGAVSADLTLALAAMVDDATAGTVLTEANDLTTAAGEVTTAANSAVTPITNAAREATIGRRAALFHADATFEARFPGAAGNMMVIITGRLAANALITQNSQPAVSQIRNGDLVVIERAADAFIYAATRTSGVWSFVDQNGGSVALSSLTPGTDRVYPLTLAVEIEMPGKFAQPVVWDRLTISELPERLADSATQVFASSISNRLQELETPLVLNAAGIQAAQLAGFLIGLTDWKAKLTSSDPDRLTSSATYELAGGSDGKRPEASAYEGSGDDSTPVKSGLKSLEDLEDISIIAAPGYSHDYATRQAAVDQINQHLISHCERMRYRVAVLDSPNNQSLSNVRDYRAVMDSKYAAVYYPWVRILDPVSNRQMDVPPSGFMAGIYARNDNENGVHKAPANEIVRGAIGLESLVNKAQQDVLNPLGINCIRYFEGRGFNVWGARTISSDPEWKYLNIRRYFVYLEASIDRSTQWAVFEPNGEALWANVRRAVEDFLFNEWKEERLAGAKPEEAFFVRCDRSTMTQNDLDNGRMICLIGVAPLYPAEFVIFRIGQWTADRS
jgi:uncharacterized protein